MASGPGFGAFEALVRLPPTPPGPGADEAVERLAAAGRFQTGGADEAEGAEVFVA